MARGWESKAVEAQLEAAAEIPAKANPRLTPEQAAKQRKRQQLQLSRTHVLQQLEAAANGRHLQMLRQSLAALDAQIAELAD
ncbi:MAG TPA: hypothetical protein VFA89_13165 [Terriglobales bacterium]|nr:hypothetical protein [Terriglobales bacterium]